MIRAWTASLMLHLLLAGLLLGLGHSLPRSRPLHIEVELVSAPPRPAAADTASRPEPPIQAPKEQAAKPVPAPALKPVKKPANRPLPPPAPAAVRMTPPEPPALPEPLQAPRATTALTTAQEPVSPTAAKRATASTPAETPPAAGTPTARTKELPNPEPATASDLGPQFNDIRDRVMASLRYPPMARRQGWRGVVRVEFTLLSSGQVQDLRILQSSGYPLLDRQALRAVEEAAPFSPPTAAATITLPIRFRLE